LPIPKATCRREPSLSRDEIESRSARTIPKGLRPPAQGCEERATLGNHRENFATPLGLCVSRTVTQGSSCLATLGFGSESRWDSQTGQQAWRRRWKCSSLRSQLRLGRPERQPATAHVQTRIALCKPLLHMQQQVVMAIMDLGCGPHPGVP
jgi:hypothetical protein